MNLGDKGFVFQDSWETAETPEEARETYEKLLQDENLHSASITGVIESTDYSPVDFQSLKNEG